MLTSPRDSACVLQPVCSHKVTSGFPTVPTRSIAPRSIGTPLTSSVSTRPPTRLCASSTITRCPNLRSCCAAHSPEKAADAKRKREEVRGGEQRKEGANEDAAYAHLRCQRPPPRSSSARRRPCRRPFRRRPPRGRPLRHRPLRHRPLHHRPLRRHCGSLVWPTRRRPRGRWRREAWGCAARGAWRRQS